LVFGLGIDIIEVSRIDEKIKSNDRNFIERIFTRNEINYCETVLNKEQNYAARFTAKEALLKAMGHGLGGFSFTDIEILKDDRGRPFINPLGRVKTFFKEKNIARVHLSMTHIKEVATSVVVLETVEGGCNCHNSPVNNGGTDDE
jgi:holo-[acyl-carrier protein] synthase